MKYPTLTVRLDKNTKAKLKTAQFQSKKTWHQFIEELLELYYQKHDRRKKDK